MADVITIPDAGKNKLLEIALGIDSAENLLLKLFTDDETIDADTVVGDLTEMTVSDNSAYAAKTLVMASWGTPAVTATQSISTYAQQSFVFAEEAVSVDVYGYYVVMAITGTLLWVNKFGAAKPIQYAGEQISVTPELRLG